MNSRKPVYLDLFMTGKTDHIELNWFVICFHLIGYNTMLPQILSRHWHSTPPILNVDSNIWHKHAYGNIYKKHNNYLQRQWWCSIIVHSPVLHTICIDREPSGNICPLLHLIITILPVFLLLLSAVAFIIYGAGMQSSTIINWTRLTFILKY